MKRKKRSAEYTIVTGFTVHCTQFRAENAKKRLTGRLVDDSLQNGFYWKATSMKLITAVIRPDRLREVKEALFRVGVTGMTLSRVSGHGGEREIVEHYRGSSLVLEFREKVKIEAAVSEPYVEPTIRAIVSAARTGEVGDGKIFVQDLDRVIRIRTGESDIAALTPVTADVVQARARQAQVEEILS